MYTGNILGITIFALIGFDAGLASNRYNNWIVAAGVILVVSIGWMVHQIRTAPFMKD